MASDVPEASIPGNAGQIRWLDLVRLILALILTPAVLIYAWGRVLIFGMFRTWPETIYVGALVFGIAAVILLTAGLSARLRSPGLDRWVIAGVPTLWIGVCAFIVWLRIGDFIPRQIVGFLFILATLWVMWSAWMFYRPWSWGLRIGVLLALIPFAVAFPMILRVEGLTGEANVNFAWRNAPIVDHGADLPAAQAESATGIICDLNATTPHDTPQFLGPQRTGVFSDAGLTPDWNGTPPREVWRQPVGAGLGSFAVVGDFAVTQEQRGEKECVVCYRLSDGKLMWLHSDEARFDSSMGGTGPRGTPAIADGTVYTVGGTGILNCLRGDNGEQIWSVDILKDNGGRPIAHGVCGSPLVAGEWVIVAPTGAEGVCLAAYNRQTGKRVWRGGRHEASYGSPTVVELAGVRQVLIATSDGIEGSDFQTGKPLWNYMWTPETHVNCSQPIVVDAAAGKVLFCTGYNTGSVLLKVSAPAGGSCGVAELWKSPQKMRTKFTTAIMHRSFAYGLDDGILACLDVATGKQVWKGGRYQHGQLLLAGDLLIVQAENGEVVLVQPDPTKLIELARIPALSSKTWNNPALAGRFLLVRNDQEAVCFELPVRP
ncbi:MAG: PQQ-binding-like beta-propeller repeat protein [Deltaproteobacteria bacterium]